MSHRLAVRHAAGLGLQLLLLAACSARGPAIDPQTLPPGCADSSCCPPGFRVVLGTEGNDRLEGNRRRDCMVALAGDDRLRGRRGDDLLVAGDGTDRGHGGWGADLVLGAAGDDDLRASWGADRLLGRAGDDTLAGGWGADSLSGGPGADRLDGGRGADLLRGGRGADSMSAGKGDDVFLVGAACEAASGELIDGGPGLDRLRSPLTRAQLEGLGVSVVSVEQFESIPLLSDECVDVEKPWGPAPVAAPGGRPFEALGRRADGTVLAATGNGVFSVGPAGVIALLQAGDRAVVNPTGETFGLHVGDDFRIYDHQGVSLGTITGVTRSRFFRLIPGGDRLLVYTLRVALHTATVEGIRLQRADGTLVSEFTTPGLRISRFDAGDLVYATPNQLLRRRLDGTLVWAADVSLHRFEVAAGRIIAVPQHVPGRLLHLHNGVRTHESLVDGPLWNLAVSPSGEYSAATTQTTLYVFREGAPTAVVALEVAYANTLDVSDRGEILVGAQAAGGQGRILLYHYQGTRLWEEDLGSEPNAYRPAVSFAADGNRFFVIEAGGLAAYDIQRSP